MPNIVHKAKIAVEKPNAIMLSMQEAYWASLNNVTNNLSNAGTYGFKSIMLKLEHVVNTNKSGNKVYYTKASDMVRDTTNGSFNKTDNPLDLCLNGSGYFMVETPKGNFLTRNGQFTTDVSGTLITTSGGFKVLDQGGSQIQLPINSKKIIITEDGTVVIADGPTTDTMTTKKYNKIGVFSVQDEQALKNIGNNLLSSPDQPQDATSYQILQGGLEGSNVSAMEAGIELMKIMRLYENAQKLIEKYEQARRQTINVSTKG